MVRVYAPSWYVARPGYPSKNNIDALLAAWLGSLLNGPIADRLGRKLSINLAVVIFVIGSAIQCGAVAIPMVFAGMFDRMGHS